MQGFNFTDESEAFQLCEADEQRALYKCGHLDKLDFVAKLKKSDSMTNIVDDDASGAANGSSAPQSHRVQSAGAKTFFGKPIDFEVGIGCLRSVRLVKTRNIP